MHRVLLLASLALASCRSSPLELESLPRGVYRLVDNGVRCVQAPCPTIDVQKVDGPEATTVSNIEYPDFMSTEQRERLQEALFQGGFVASGEVDANVEGG